LDRRALLLVLGGPLAAGDFAQEDKTLVQQLLDEVAPDGDDLAGLGCWECVVSVSVGVLCVCVMSVL
jgi:hypothetical protein